MSHDGSQRRVKRKSIERSRRPPRAVPVEEPHPANDSQIAERVQVLVDDEAWKRAGEELRRRDPSRYIAILKVVEDICSIHRDPLGEIVSDGFYVFPKVKSDQFD